MKEDLYLNKIKNRLNKDESNEFIFDESQTGPQEEPILVQYDVDINKFQEYMKKRKNSKDAV